MPIINKIAILGQGTQVSFHGGGKGWNQLKGQAEGSAMQEGLALQAFITFKIFQCHHKGPVLIGLGTGILGSLGVCQPGLL